MNSHFIHRFQTLHNLVQGDFSYMVRCIPLDFAQYNLILVLQLILQLI